MRPIRGFFHALIRISALTTFALGGVHLVRVRTSRGLPLRGLKTIAEGLSPFLAVTGVASALGALWIGAPFTSLVAVVGALLHASYIRKVTRPHTAFEDPFGKNWDREINTHITQPHKEALLQRRWTWRMPTPRGTALWERDMIYHTVPAVNDLPEIPLHCDLWLPPENILPSGMAILYVHGGGYFTTAKDFGTRTFFRHLAAQGHMAMDINYRLAPQATLLDMVSDVLHAVAWLKENAEVFCARPDRVVLAGGSAGAQLALLAAYAHDSPAIKPPDLLGQDLSVRAVVSYYGVIDLAAAYRRLNTLFKSIVRRQISDHWLDRPMVRRALSAAAWVRGVEPQALRQYVLQNQAVLSAGLDTALSHLVGGTPGQAPEIYHLVSPLTYVSPACPPTLLIQGAHDYLLPASITHQLHSRLRAAGVPSVYIELPQTEHTFDQFLPAFSPPAQAALYDLERFLALVA